MAVPQFSPGKQIICLYFEYKVKYSYALVAQWIERDVADVEVEGSTPFESANGGVPKWS